MQRVLLDRREWFAKALAFDEKPKLGSQVRNLAMFTREFRECFGNALRMKFEFYADDVLFTNLVQPGNLLGLTEVAKTSLSFQATPVVLAENGQHRVT